MIFKPFFQIDIEHQYFSSTGTDDLIIVPEKETLRVLTGNKLVLKGTRNGLMALIPADENGNANPTFLPNQVASFKVFPQSSAFSLFTSLPNLVAGEVQLFSNATLTANDSLLLSSTTIASDVLNGFPLVAKVEINLSEALQTRTKDLPYKVFFPAKAEKWKYYFVSDSETTDLSIEDRDLRLVFNKQLIDANTSDKIGLALRENFPDANLFLFETNTPVTFSDRALKNLQLLRDGHVLIKHLPNPETGDEAIKIINIHK